MKKTTLLLLIITSLIVLNSCEKGPVWGIKGQGNSVTETRITNNFNKIELRICADVYYTQDSVYYVEIQAQQNILDVLTTEVYGNTLEIDFSKRVRKHDGIKIIIHSPNMEGLYLCGSGDIFVEDSINTSQMDVEISGSGNINIPSIQSQYTYIEVTGSGNIQIQNLESTNLTGEVTGSGDISIYNGSASNEELLISGSGDINTVGLLANTATAKITGSGNISVYVSQTLNATITGSGDIRYKGNPHVNVNITGSGVVEHIY